VAQMTVGENNMVFYSHFGFLFQVEVSTSKL
jgi:hypothetical protein